MSFDKIIDADKSIGVLKFKTVENGLKLVYDEDEDLAFIHKENVVGLLGLDKDKASSWKYIYKLFDEAANEWYESTGDYRYTIGYSTDEYLAKRDKYEDENSIPTLLRKYEYFNERIVELMLLKSNLKKGKKYRVAIASFKASKYAYYFKRF